MAQMSEYEELDMKRRLFPDGMLQSEWARLRELEVQMGLAPAPTPTPIPAPGPGALPVPNKPIPTPNPTVTPVAAPASGGSGLGSQIQGLIDGFKSLFRGVQGPPKPGSEQGKGSLAHMLGMGNSQKRGERADKVAGIANSLGFGGIGKAAGLVATGARAMEGDPTAIVELAKEGVKYSIDHVKDVGRNLMAGAGDVRNAIGSERGEDVGANLFKATGHMSHAMGLAGKPIEWLSKLGEAGMEAVGTLRKWTDSLNQANMKFAEFSGAMSAVQARQQVRDILLSQERGGRRAESAELLAQGKNSLDRGMAPFEDKWAELKGRYLAVMTQQLGDILQIATKWLGLVDPNKGKAESPQSLEFKDVERRWARHHGRPPRFGPGE